MVDRVKTLDETLATLQVLTTTLEQPLLPFTQTYVIITQIMIKALQEKAFKNPSLVTAFIIEFANYYFDTLSDLHSDQTTATAWQLTYTNGNPGRRPAFISLLMGANAHINYDLPLALMKVLDASKTSLSYSDMQTLDRLIMKSAREILDAFDEPYQPAAFIKHYGRPLYLRPTMWMIRIWRIVAWRQYLALTRRQIDLEKFGKRSARIAKRLAWLGRVLTGSEKQ